MKSDGVPNLTEIAVTPRMLALVAGIDEFKGAWRAIGRLAPERLSALRRVATIESVASSTRIEGAKLTDVEVERLLSHLRIQSLATRDEQEIAGYAEVMETLFAHWESITLTENHIRQLHRDLLKYSARDERHRGHYKKVSNDVQAYDAGGKLIGVVFETATPFETPRLTKGLVDWTRAALERDEMHPLLIIAVFIVSFLAIHPFQDGNGRLSRILTTLLLLRAGYAYVPYGSLESVIEQSKEGYYLALRQTQGTLKSSAPNWRPWLEYFLNALGEQKARLERKLDREHAVFGSLSELSLRIVELCRERGRLTLREIAGVTGASRNTIKDHMAVLVQRRLLVRRGAGRGTWYALT